MWAWIKRTARAVFSWIHRRLVAWHIIRNIPLHARMNMPEAAIQALPPGAQQLLTESAGARRFVRSGHLSLEALSALNRDSWNALKRLHIRRLIQSRWLSLAALDNLRDSAFAALRKPSVRSFLTRHAWLTPNHLQSFSNDACDALSSPAIRRLIQQGYLPLGSFNRLTEITHQALRSRWVRGFIRSGLLTLEQLLTSSFDFDIDTLNTSTSRRALRRQLMGWGASRLRQARIRRLIKSHRLDIDTLQRLNPNTFDALSHRGICSLVQQGWLQIDFLQEIVNGRDATVLAALKHFRVRQLIRQGHLCIQDLIDNDDNLCRELQNRRFRAALRQDNPHTQLSRSTQRMLRRKSIQRWLKKSWITVEELHETNHTRSSEHDLNEVFQALKHKSVQRLIDAGHLTVRDICEFSQSTCRVLRRTRPGARTVIWLIEQRYITPTQCRDFTDAQWESLAHPNCCVLIQERQLSVPLFQKLSSHERNLLTGAANLRTVLPNIIQTHADQAKAFLVKQAPEAEQARIDASIEHLREHYQTVDLDTDDCLSKLCGALEAVPADKANGAIASTRIQTIARFNESAKQQLALLFLAIQDDSYRKNSGTTHVFTIFANAINEAHKHKQPWTISTHTFLAPYLPDVSNPHFAASAR